jgi:hypothetical protein
MNLKKNPEEHLLTKTSPPPQREITSLFAFSFLHLFRRKLVKNVTPSVKRFAGSDP